MFDRLRREDLISVEHLNDLLKKMNMKQVPVKKKRSTVWLAVLIVLLSVAGIGYAVYKYFFAIEDDFEDFDEYDEDFEDIDYEEEEEVEADEEEETEEEEEKE